MPIHVYWHDAEDGDASMADLGDRCLGSQRFAGQDEVMADAVFATVKNQKEKGKSWWWDCMSVVLATESDADPILCKLQCKLCKQLLSPSNPPTTCKTHLKSSVCIFYHKGVKEGLIPTEQQHRAPAGSSSIGHRQAAAAPGRQEAAAAAASASNARRHCRQVSCGLTT